MTSGLTPTTNLTPAGETLAANAVAAILEHAGESPNSQNEPRGDKSRLRAALEDVLRGTSPFHSGGYPASQRTLAGARQIQALGQIAGSINFGPEIGRGGEHIVFREPGDTEVPKLTLPDFAGYGYVLDIELGTVWLRPAIASEYFGRLGLMDAVFGVLVRITGIVANAGGQPQIASSQPWIDGTIPDPGETAEWLAEQGFYAVARRFHDRGTVPAGSVWYRPSDNILMGDAVPRNFIKTPDGLMIPIDVSLTLIPEGILPAAAVPGEASL